MVMGDQWVGYDDVDSLRIKVRPSMFANCVLRNQMPSRIKKKNGLTTKPINKSFNKPFSSKANSIQFYKQCYVIG